MTADYALVVADRPLASVAAAREQAAAAALAPSEVGAVGLELEINIVDHPRPATRNSRLSSLLPERTTGPFSLPFRMASGVSRMSSAFALV